MVQCKNLKEERDKVMVTSFYRRPLAIGAAAVSLAASLAYGEVIYENDFATRTSKGAVPYGGWREQPYVTGKFVNSDPSKPFDGTDIQDGWILSKAVNQCPVTILADNGNQEMVFYRPVNTDPKTSLVRQRIGNTFTNGTVVAQCDVRVPSAWFANGQATFTLGDESFFSPEVSHDDSQTHRVAQVGIIQDSEGYKFWHRGKSGNVKELGVNQSHWYRIVIVVYLDTLMWHCRIHDLGTEHPTLDTPTPAEAAFSSSLGLDIPYDNARSISSFSLDGFYPGGSTSAEGIANAILFDNVRIWHNDVECYANDFNTRRSRVIGGTPTATYEANSLLVTNTVGTGTYVVGRNLYPASTGTNVAQPVGIDGWRRINSTGPNTFSVYDKGYNDSTNNPCVGMLEKTSFGLAVQPIGSTLRGGKVRLSADMRTTGMKDDDTNQQNMSVMLGSDVLYNGNNSTYVNGYCARAGLCAYRKTINGLTYRRPQYFVDGASTYPTGENEWVKQGTWLRIILEVDLENGTYSVQFLDQGAHPEAWATDGTTVCYQKTDIKFYKPIEEITCYGLVSYYSTAVYFDNIKIWHTASGASSARLVYENTFTSRTLYHDSLREGSLVGTLNRNPVGQDGWTRAGKFESKVSVRNDMANPAMAFGDTNIKPAYALHDIGMLCKNGEMTTQIDAKPPKYWSGSNRGTFFWLGGDRFHEGSLKGGDEFYTHAATFFGFRDAVGGTANNVYTNVSLCAYNGNGSGGGSYTNSTVVVDPTHWYRFVAKTSLKAGESNIAVYDMGTNHPTLATATPAEPIETFTGIKFRRAPQSIKGVSSFCILGQGTSDNTLDKTVGTFWDNIRIDYTPPGMMIFIR